MKRINELSGYRILWIYVMFDLPTDTKLQRKAASKFREFLLDEGFQRAQFSVYGRFVNGKEGFDTRVKRIVSRAPARGMVTIFHITDKQYEKMIHIYDQGRSKQERAEKRIGSQLLLF